MSGLRSPCSGLWLLALVFTPEARATPPEADARVSTAREAATLRNEAMELFRARDYPGSIERLERALALEPENHELVRMLGVCHVHAGEPERGRQRYREYVARCPGCMYAPVVTRMLESDGRPPPRAAPEEKPPEAEPEAAGEGAELTRWAEILAGRLVANAGTIRRSNPLGAVANCLEAMRLVVRAHPLHAEARALFTELTWMPPPPLAAPEAREPSAAERHLANLDASAKETLRLLERARVEDPRRAALMARTLAIIHSDDTPDMARVPLRALEILRELEGDEAADRALESRTDFQHRHGSRKAPPATP
jgi:hypothetical protein